MSLAELTHMDLDVLFGRHGDGFRAQVVKSPAGDGQAVTFTPPFTDLELENFLLKMGGLRVRTRRVDPAPVGAAKEIGGRLFEAVFTGEVGECLRRSLDRADDAGVPLRIRLRLTECAELADLPWELLYDRGDDWFLALSGNTPVVRYMQLPVQPRPVRVSLPLRVLVIRSEPTDYPPLNLEAEWAQVADSLRELSDAGLVAFTELAHATLSELRRALLRDSFHVLHFMGHGGFDERRGGVLLFTGPAGRGTPVTAGDLGVMLRDHSSLRLAVLNACEAGRTDPADPFAGVADTLVRRGIPAVIAMQFEVSDHAAVEFAPALYGALAAGGTVDAAVAEARKAMYTVSPLEWATPVLYLRADDARLFDISDRPAPTVNMAAKRADEGASLLREYRYADAESAYRTALGLDSRLARAHVGLGRALGGQKRYQEAEAACREALRLDPGYAPAHYYLGLVCGQSKRYAEAEAAYREAIRLDPGYAPAHYNLGLLCGESKRYAEAEAAYREAIRLNPRYAEAYSELGVLFGQNERLIEAEAAFRDAIRVNPGYAPAHYNLGLVLHGTQRYAEAEAAYREAIRLDPDDPQARDNLRELLKSRKWWNRL
jgi:tetratricopeptide (TPR) repeat protein